MNLKGIRLCVAILLSILSTASLAQVRTLRGIVKDTHSDELIPFATIQFTKSGFGKLTDSSGTFSITLSKWPSDTVVITYAGFETKLIPIDTTQFDINLVVAMERGKPAGEVVIRSKWNRGLFLWKKIVKNKPVNKSARFSNFAYELYNKLLPYDSDRSR